jgi:TetR/AcrR family transcriptional repressor of nem operon
MQDSHPAPSERPRRGRPRSFDLEAATAAALQTLWVKGYEASSVEDLGKATGLAPSSLYAAFGSKRGVLEAALARYDRDRDELLAPLEHGTAGLADLRRFLEQIRRTVTEPGIPGCFMVNTATEVAPRDSRIAEHANRYRGRVRDGIAAALGRALTQDEIRSVDPLDQARIVQAGLYGALVAARAGAGEEALATVDALERQLERLVVPSGD